MGLFSRKKDKVTKLVEYGQIQSNNDIFPSTYFIEELMMDDRERDARYPKRFNCLAGGAYRSFDKTTFVRTGSSSYKATVYNDYGSVDAELIIHNLVPMTPIGTKLRDGGKFVLLTKNYDWGKEYFDNNNRCVRIREIQTLYVVESDTYYMKIEGRGSVENILRSMGYMFF